MSVVSPPAPTLPAWRRVRDRLAARPALQAVLRNCSWLVFDKLFRMGVGLLVGAWVARYLGPAQIGLLSYAASFAGLFNALATLGLDNVVIRELLRRPDERDALLGTAFTLKLAGAVLALVLAVAGIAAMRPGEGFTLLLVAVSAAGFLFQSLLTIDFHFQATVNARRTVVASSLAFIATSVVKVALLLTDAPLVSFAWVGLLELALTAWFLLIALRRAGLDERRWRFSAATARRLLGESWPLIPSAIAVVVYMRLDQVMIGEMLGETAVGLFSVAVRISEIWYFIPYAIAASVYPSLVEARRRDEAQFNRRMQHLYDLMTWLGIGVALLATLLGRWFIGALYGPEFLPAANVLAIQIWSGIVICMAAVHSKWISIEGLQKYSLVYTLTALVMNVSLNLLLIPRMGIEGAAVATLVAQFSPMWMQLFQPRSRANFRRMLRSFAAPVFIGARLLRR